MQCPYCSGQKNILCLVNIQYNAPIFGVFLHHWTVKYRNVIQSCGAQCCCVVMQVWSGWKQQGLSSYDKHCYHTSASHLAK